MSTPLPQRSQESNEWSLRRTSSSSSSSSSSTASASSSLLAASLSKFEMTGKPIKRVFFSPHPDDIAYSCFGTVSTKPTCCACQRSASGKWSPLAKTRALAALGIMTPPASPMIDGKENYFSSPSSSRRGSRSSSPLPQSPSMSLAYGMHKETWKRYEPTKVAEREGLNLAGPRVSTSSSGDLVVTVFSTSRCANGEIGASLEHNVCKTTTLRAEEDDAFARVVDADLIWLGFPDSSARDEYSRRPDLGEDVLHGTPSATCGHVDHPIFDDVRCALTPIVLKAVASQAAMYVPLGVGCHVDHWMVRVAVLSIIDELVITSVQGDASSLYSLVSFYEDLPYADQTTAGAIEDLARAVLPIGAEPRLVPLRRSLWKRKEAAVQAYASQMKPTILPSLSDHSIHLAERGTQIDAAWASVSGKNKARSRLRERPSDIVGAERLWVVPAKSLGRRSEDHHLSSEG